MPHSRHRAAFVELNRNPIACLQMRRVVDDAAVLRLDVGEAAGEDVVGVELNEGAVVAAKLVAALL